MISFFPSASFLSLFLCVRLFVNTPVCFLYIIYYSVERKIVRENIPSLAKQSHLISVATIYICYVLKNIVAILNVNLHL